MKGSLVTRSGLTAGAAALAVAAFLSACGSKSNAQAGAESEASAEALSMACALATRGSLERVVDLRGRISTRPGGDLPVAAVVIGKIVEVKVDEGARIKKGTIVAIVDDLQPRTAATQAQASVTRAVATTVETDHALERAKKLAADGIISRADLETAQSRADAAKSDLVAQQAAANLAGGTLARIEVKSTFDGVVTKVWRGAGALLDGTAATPIIQLAEDDALEFVGDTTERDLELLSIGEKTDLVLSANATALHGEVVFVPRAVDPKTGLGEIRILLDAHERAALDHLRIGAFGHARVHARALADALFIPRAALRGAVLDGAEVAVCSDGKASIRKITVGYRDSDRIEVLSGLNAGERVAIGDVLGVSDGTAICETAPSAAPSADPSGAEPP